LARAIGRLRPKTVVTWKGENNKKDGPKGIFKMENGASARQHLLFFSFFLLDTRTRRKRFKRDKQIDR
jgi:hypothetical protein